MLVLEGIEKAERNVLPVLNNLLENREMQLDDGRFIVAHERYDKLLQVGSILRRDFFKRKRRILLRMLWLIVQEEEMVLVW